jgi:hypothetical protein
VLCDNCGISWRKYADLNIRPLREDPASKSKPAEKREGTPLAQTTAKRPRVGYWLLLPDMAPDILIDIRIDLHTTATCCPPDSLFGMSQEWPRRKDSSLSTMSIPRPPRLAEFCIKASSYLIGCTGAYGATIDPASSDNWTCELCLNEKNLEASLVCLLSSCCHSPLLILVHRNRIAFFALGSAGTRRRSSYTPHQIPISGRANLPKVMPGATSSAPCLYPKSILQMQAACG